MGSDRTEDEVSDGEGPAVRAPASASETTSTAWIRWCRLGEPVVLEVEDQAEADQEAEGGGTITAVAATNGCACPVKICVP